MRILLLLCGCIASGTLLSQEVPEQTSKDIYATLLNYYHFPQLVADSTSNNFLVTEDFKSLASYYRPPKERRRFTLLGELDLDSTWVEDLMKAEVMKKEMTTEVFPKMQINQLQVPVINKKQLESLKIENGVIPVVPDYLQFSGVLLIGSRAIVSVEVRTADLRGGSKLFFLEKRDCKWIIIGYLIQSMA